jgi:23S rRNA (cytidine1920-2'-O)/16S rRNA (cytidine1409-2'-O)-methyltransferase
LLQRGALFVYAIDVGYGQIDWSLRNDPRVKVIDRLNARYLTKEIYVTAAATFVCMDVSFISVTKVLPALKSMTIDECEMELVCLVKPQFEAGRQAVGKGGVVRSPAVHVEVLASVTHAAEQLGFGVLGATHSPIKGPAGNIEFLLHLTTAACGAHDLDLVQLVRNCADL